MFLACREQHARREKVDCRSDDRDCKPDSNVGQGLRVNQPFDGGYADGTGRKQDQEDAYAMQKLRKEGYM